MKFNLLKDAKFPSISNECNKIDVVDGLMWETMSNLDSNDPLEHLMLNDSTTKDAKSRSSHASLTSGSLSTNSTFPY